MTPILTIAEKGVLYSAARGKTIPESAVELARTVDMVKYYRNSVVQKLEAKNFTHAVAIAIRKGLIFA